MNLDNSIVKVNLSQLSRYFYLYGDNNEAAAEAANQLRQAGYSNVALVQGGLSA